ncbi:hypothetical protein CVT24_011093 [Panaeolus cyanescens]|uniref:Ribonuclease H1 N-terminal domain-containing protein n=1 Tax=Panaeolus cyanescens TaxID=181874 RepID=A0A409YVD8_9AGAR|nr:hypothetical protein CVT24_011093 [Panaeolus cyanescens]
MPSKPKTESRTQPNSLSQSQPVHELPASWNTQDLCVFSLSPDLPFDRAVDQARIQLENARSQLRFLSLVHEASKRAPPTSRPTVDTRPTVVKCATTPTSNICTPTRPPQPQALRNTSHQQPSIGYTTHRTQLRDDGPWPPITEDDSEKKHSKEDEDRARYLLAQTDGLATPHQSHHRLATTDRLASPHQRATPSTARTADPSTRITSSGRSAATPSRIASTTTSSSDTPLISVFATPVTESSPYQKRKYYSVTKGRCIGVVDSWSTASALISNIPGGRQRGFPSYAEALADYRNAQRQGIAKVVRITDEDDSMWGDVKFAVMP